MTSTIVVINTERAKIWNMIDVHVLIIAFTTNCTSFIVVATGANARQNHQYLMIQTISLSTPAGMLDQVYCDLWVVIYVHTWVNST